MTGKKCGTTYLFVFDYDTEDVQYPNYFDVK